MANGQNTLGAAVNDDMWRWVKSYCRKHKIGKSEVVRRAVEALQAEDCANKKTKKKSA